MLSEPLVSVVTPSLNQASFIEETICSVLGQMRSYVRLEHVVVDGGSIDGTIEILGRYNHLRWISKPDEGQAHAINKGLRMARGEILAYLNADDTYEPGAIGQVVGFLLRRPELAAVYGICNVIDSRGRLLKVWNPPEFEWHSYLRVGFSYIPQPTFFFRRSALQSVGLLDPSLSHAMDYDFFARLGEQNAIGRLDRVLANFRIHSRSKTSREIARQRAESKIVRRRYLRENVLLSGCGLLVYKFRRAWSWPKGGPPPLLEAMRYVLKRVSTSALDEECM